MKASGDTKNDLPVMPFKNQTAWAVWLEKNHSKSAGVWLKLAKKGATTASLSYAEAIESALCYGWIDGQKKPFDESWWLQRFTPRGPKSIWSKINRDKAEALIASGQMRAGGERAIDAAKKDGRWDRAYDGQRSAGIPDDLKTALDQNPKANAFFATLDSANRYAILFRVQTAKKSETRERRIQQFVEMLARHEKIHPTA